MLLLPLRQLIAFNDEFAKFFHDQTGVENVDYLECIYDPSQQVVRIADQEPRG